MNTRLQIFKRIASVLITLCMMCIILCICLLFNKRLVVPQHQEMIVTGEPIPQEIQISDDNLSHDNNEPYVMLSEDEAQMIAQILYLEARGESVQCQEAVVSVILNRMKNEGLSAQDVIFASNQFTTASFIEKGDPSDDMINIVQTLAEEGPTIPSYITYFRADHYHEWDNAYGTVVRYTNMDNTYFSYDVKLKEQHDKETEVQ